jgi:hypothetical protein
MVGFNVPPTQYNSYGDFTALLVEEDLIGALLCTIAGTKTYT